MQLIEKFKGQVPDSTSFPVGYFEGSRQVKIWLVIDNDLKQMYEIHNKGRQISIWCEGVSNDGHIRREREVYLSVKRRRKMWITLRCCRRSNLLLLCYVRGPMAFITVLTVLIFLHSHNHNQRNHANRNHCLTLSVRLQYLLFMLYLDHHLKRKRRANHPLQNC